MDAGISEARVELLIENALAKSKGDLEKMESSLKILKDKIAVFETNHGKEYKLVQEKILDLQKSVSDKTSSRSDELDQVSKIIGTLKQRLDQTEKALENAITQETFDNLIKERYSKLVINNPFMHIYVCQDSLVGEQKQNIESYRDQLKTNYVSTLEFKKLRDQFAEFNQQMTEKITKAKADAQRISSKELEKINEFNNKIQSIERQLINQEVFSI